jgi:hypothetical protein
LRGMVEAVEELLPMIDGSTVVVPGHGAAADRTRLLGFRDMLRRIEDRILALVEAQLETREIMSTQPTAEFDPLRGRGYVTGMHFTRMVLAGMGRNQAPVGPQSSATDR